MLVNRIWSEAACTIDVLCSTSCYAMDLVLLSPGKSMNAKSEPAPTSLSKFPT